MAESLGILGAPNTNRTCDLPLRRGLLYPLSYRGLLLMAGQHFKGFFTALPSSAIFCRPDLHPKTRITP